MSSIVCTIDGQHVYDNGKVRRPNLTPEDHQEIREMYCKGQRLLAERNRHYSIDAIGRQFGRSKNCIWALVNGLNELECEGL